MKKLDYRLDWDTSDEVVFLDALGTHTKKRLTDKEWKERRTRLYEGAIEGYSKRVKWGDVKKIIAIQHLEMLIRRDNASHDL